MSRLTEVLDAQLTAQGCVDDTAFKAAAEIRDGRLRKLTLRERLQLKLACGILERLVER